MEDSRSRLAGPLRDSGALAGYGYEDVTPAIGREYEDLQLRELLSAAASEAMIRDLAATS